MKRKWLSDFRSVSENKSERRHPVLFRLSGDILYIPENKSEKSPHWNATVFRRRNAAQKTKVKDENNRRPDYMPRLKDAIPESAARAKAIELYQAGMGVKRIAKQLHRAELTINGWLDSAGIPRHPTGHQGGVPTNGGRREPYGKRTAAQKLKASQATVTISDRERRVIGSMFDDEENRRLNVTVGIIRTCACGSVLQDPAASACRRCR